jgi:7-cyano-7-deazaguanine synthase
MTNGKKAVVLSSGGLDSTTAMAIAKQEGFDIYSLSFLYGQRHSLELDAAAKVSDFLGAIKHLVIEIDLKTIGGSALTDNTIEVPKSRNEADMSDGIPATYVPARNTIFLSYALAWAEVLPAYDIFIGVNAVDYSGYPDCRPEYIEAFEHMANLATKVGADGHAIKIRAPLSNLTKAKIIKKGIALGIDYSITHSCYDPSPDGLACSQCDSCLLRKKGFKEAGIKDPTKYII